MTTKNTYWIKNPNGYYAQVEGADERDRWTKVQGWTEADEPPPTAQVYIQHPDLAEYGLIPFEALGGQWEALGWTAGPPPEPRDITKDPALVDQPAAARVAAPAAPAPAEEPAKPQTPAATGGAKSKEQ